jgi:hypothetical protein
MRGPNQLCRLPSCAARKGNGSIPFCTTHWAALPEDLRQRVQWANTEGELDDYRAALHAAYEALRKVA